MSNEMVKRVAEAISDEYNGYCSPEMFRAQARAAIEAMREPTEAMLAAHQAYCDEKYETGNIPTLIGMWRVMIAAALKEQP